jgi:hypothetical protein
MTTGINSSVKKTFLFPLPEIKPARPIKKITAKMIPIDIKNAMF